MLLHVHGNFKQSAELIIVLYFLNLINHESKMVDSLVVISQLEATNV